MSFDSNMVHKNEGFNRLPSKLDFAASSVYVNIAGKVTGLLPASQQNTAYKKEKI